MRCSSAARGAPILLVLAVALGAPSAACRPGAREDAPRTADAAARYTVRGEIVRLPEPGAKVREVQLRHEAIPDFADESGAVVGMPAMVMPFQVAPAVRLEEARAGDKVEVRLAVTWNPPVLRIEELRKLPPDAVLRFGAGR